MNEIDNSKTGVDIYLERVFSGYPRTEKNLEIKERIRQNMYAGLENMIEKGLSPKEAQEKLMEEFKDMSDLKEVLDTEEKAVSKKEEKKRKVPKINIYIAAIIFFFLVAPRFYGNSWMGFIIAILLIEVIDKKINGKSSD